MAYATSPSPAALATQPTSTSLTLAPSRTSRHAHHSPTNGTVAQQNTTATSSSSRISALADPSSPAGHFAAYVASHCANICSYDEPRPSLRPFPPGAGDGQSGDRRRG